MPSPLDMLLIAQGILALVGLAAVAGSKVPLSPRRLVQGWPARGAGGLLLLPLLGQSVVLLVWQLVQRAQSALQHYPGNDPSFLDSPLAHYLMLGFTILCVLAAGLLLWTKSEFLVLKQQTPWTREKVRELLLPLLLAGLAGLVWMMTTAHTADQSRPALRTWQQTLLWLLYAALTIGLLREGWLKLFGPVFFYDMVRTGRRGRFVLLRMLYASVMLLVLAWTYANAVNQAWRRPLDEAKLAAVLATEFFNTFMILQLSTVLILTPAYTAGAIAEEKDRRTLEYLLATDLYNREIIFGKMLSRLANLSLLVLAGLPILSLLQFMGGVDPGLTLAGFAATWLMMMSLTALGMLMSVHARKSRDAIALTYLAAVAYLGLYLLLWLLSFAAPAFTGLALTPGENPVVIQDLCDWANSGNIIYAYVEIVKAQSAKTPGAGVLGVLLGRFAIFHGVATLLFVFAAVMQLRTVALRETFGATRKLPFLTRVFGRPGIGLRPVLWKEVFAESGFRVNALGRVLISLLVIVSFVPAFWIIIYYVVEWWSALSTGTPTPRFWRSPFAEMRWMLNVWCRITGTILECLMLLAISTRAAGCISGERDRQTFDALLTSPLGSDEILFGKWLGSILSVRWAFAWLGMIWIISVAGGGVQFFAPVLIFGALLVFGAFMAALGLWYSMTCKTTLRATIWTLLSVVFLGGGHWVVLLMCCCLPLELSGAHGHDFEMIPQFISFGMTPPVTLGFLAIHGEEFDHNREEPWRFLAFSLFGIFIWALATGVLWGVLSERFRVLTGRTSIRRPDRLMRPAATPPSFPAAESPVPPP